MHFLKLHVAINISICIVACLYVQMASAEPAPLPPPRDLDFLVSSHEFAPSELANDTIFLSWSPDSVVDTLQISASGTYDFYAIFSGCSATCSFRYYEAILLVTPGITVTDIYATLSENADVLLNTDQPTSPLGYVSYLSCITIDGPAVIARYSAYIDLDALEQQGSNLIGIITDENLGSPTRIIGDTQCTQGVWDVAQGTLIFVDTPIVPTHQHSFGSLKALFR